MIERSRVWKGWQTEFAILDLGAALLYRLPLFPSLLFWGPLCFPRTRQKNMTIFVAGVRFFQPRDSTKFPGCPGSERESPSEPRARAGPRTQSLLGVFVSSCTDFILVGRTILVIKNKV